MFREFGLDTATADTTSSCGRPSRFTTKACKHFWKKIADNKTPKGNDTIYKGFYEGWFCAPCAEYKTEDEYYIPEGSDMPFCQIHERPLDKVSEESYFFRLSDYGERLLEIIENDPQRDPSRCAAKRGDRLYSDAGFRTFRSAAKSPRFRGAFRFRATTNHVMYVWLDALSNYITAIGYGNERTRRRLRQILARGASRRQRHPAISHDLLVVVPARGRTSSCRRLFMLTECGSMPKARKMGKTLGNVIEVDVLHKHFQVDAIRYFLLREMVFGQDGKIRLRESDRPGECGSRQRSRQSREPDTCR